MSNRYHWSLSDRVRRSMARLAMAAVLAAPLTSCTSAQLDGEAPVYLILGSLTAASGAQPDEFSGTLASDVLTCVSTGQTDADGNDLCAPTIFEDSMQVTFGLALKDPGSVQSPNIPSPANYVTITRYRVDFRRADGRNTPGVDVPYGFDGAATVTVTGTGGSTVVPLVRNQAKREAPLQALAFGGGAVAISTLATVTFYGHDQAGRAVSVSGQISVNFADWGDPD